MSDPTAACSCEQSLQLQTEVRRLQLSVVELERALVKRHTSVQQSSSCEQLLRDICHEYFKSDWNHSHWLALCDAYCYALEDAAWWLERAGYRSTGVPAYESLAAGVRALASVVKR